MAKMALGKGLSALIAAQPAPAPGIAAVDDSEKIQRVSLYSITPSPLQPRKDFGADALSELVESIRQHGIIQPLIVRAIDGRHELIAGERRWRAAQEAGLDEVPVIIRSASDRDVLELSLIENLQRADLNPIEEAQGYARLAGEFGMRQDEIAHKVGRSRAAVANAMRLLDLGRTRQSFACTEGAGRTVGCRGNGPKTQRHSPGDGAAGRPPTGPGQTAPSSPLIGVGERECD